MIDELLQLIALVAMAAAVLLAVVETYDNYSTPSVCRAAETALKNPGSELVVYGKVKVWHDGGSVYFSCGLVVDKSRVLFIEKTTGRLVVGSTADGMLYIK
ncbi:MAG: hypothetical protein QXP31_03360 [Pyrobaculum sp.]